jgi:myo-inositol-1(or 4)-monophosphatase
LAYEQSDRMTNAIVLPTHWLSDTCALAKEAALRAADRVRSRGKFIEKGQGDWASDVDLEIEEFIREGLANIAPGTQFCGEESAGADSRATASTSTGDAARQTEPPSAPNGSIAPNAPSEFNTSNASSLIWHVDPIDGSANYVKGIPHFATVISLSQVHSDGHEEALMGITFDPNRNECFATQVGHPTTLNGEPQRVSDCASRMRGLLAVVTPKPSSVWMPQFGQWLTHQLQQYGGVRRSGAMAIDLAWVACGRLDAFAGFHLAPWDIRAGLLQIRHSGGVHSESDPRRDHWALSPVPIAACFAANSEALLPQLEGDIHDY